MNIYTQQKQDISATIGLNKYIYIYIMSNLMRNLIVFRGDYSLVKTPSNVCKNINKYVIEPMKKNTDVDIIFCTYKSDLEKLKIYESSFNPITIHFTNNGQIINFRESLSVIRDIYEKYDYIIFLRFDIIYKMNINVDIFNKEGIIFPYKEDSEEIFNSRRLYGDVIIIISKSSFLLVVDSLVNSNIQEYQPPNCLHNIGSIIQKKVPNMLIHTIVEGYYQSRTVLAVDDPRLNPIYIQVKYPYNGNDKHLYSEFYENSITNI